MTVAVMQLITIFVGNEKQIIMESLKISKQEKGILKSLTNNRIKTWIKTGVSELDMKIYLSDKRWQYVMSQKVISFQKKYF